MFNFCFLTYFALAPIFQILDQSKDLLHVAVVIMDVGRIFYVYLRLDFLRLKLEGNGRNKKNYAQN